MRALILERLCDLSCNREPLRLVDWPTPEAGPGQVRVQVESCGVCHTELDEIEGRTPPARLPIILGHQAVGRIDQVGVGADAGRIGERVGIAWIYSACGVCRWCLRGLDNLCPEFRATGRDAHGGYAEYLVVPQAYAFALPAGFSAIEAAPLLCAGAIGYRSLRLAGIDRNSTALGLTGFGGSGHLVLKMVRYLYPQLPVYVFARSAQERCFALEQGAAWAGDTEEQPPGLLSAMIDTTPAWKPLVKALRLLEPGGRLVINAIRKEDVDRGLLSQIDYVQDLWLEKEIKSVANVAAQDVREFLALAARVPIRPTCEEFPLEEANRALLQLKERHVRGAKVLRISEL
jgi:propanol-preferring alcohol dehydrogenase